MLLILSSCATTYKARIEYRDTTIVRLDTVKIPLPKEIISEVSFSDTSHLETSLAVSDAWIDSTKRLRHTLANKDSLKTQVLYKERIVYRDSIITKEVPVIEQKVLYKTPKWVYWSLGLNVLILVLFGLKIALKWNTFL